jgi:hypothetical protein
VAPTPEIFDQRCGWDRVSRALAALLLTLGAGSAARADTRSSPVLAAITLPAGGSALDEVTVGTAVWTLSVDGNHGYLFRIDPVSNTIIAEIDLPSGSPTGDAFYQGGLVYAFGSVWVPETYRDQVWRIDPVAGRVQARISTGRYPALLAAGGGSVWASCSGTGRTAPGAAAGCARSTTRPAHASRTSLSMGGPAPWLPGSAACGTSTGGPAGCSASPPGRLRPREPAQFASVHVPDVQRTLARIGAGRRSLNND